MIATRNLGTTGIWVTTIGLGAWALGDEFWGAQDEAASLATVRRALDLGCTLFDTADIYGDGRSEEILGRVLHKDRSRVVVSTKVGWQGYDEARSRSAYDSPAKVGADVERSLQRLQTDYVDVLFCHLDRPDPHLENFLTAFRRLRQTGKVRTFGVSTSDLGYLERFNADGDCGVVQVDYSILNRTPEKDVLPYCREHGIGVLVRGPLAMGRLSGKLTPDTKFAPGDWRTRWLETPREREEFAADLRVVDGLRPLARGRTLSQVALQFVISHPAVTAAIPGARSPAQVEENLAAASPLNPAELAEIGRLVSPGGGRKIWPA
jgi:aryl-alcohol dehydrogenase-like predicted oxidoreductase